MPVGSWNWLCHRAHGLLTRPVLGEAQDGPGLSAWIVQSQESQFCILGSWRCPGLRYLGVEGQGGSLCLKAWVLLQAEMVPDIRVGARAGIAMGSSAVRSSCRLSPAQNLGNRTPRVVSPGTRARALGLRIPGPGLWQGNRPGRTLLFLSLWSLALCV